jgi:hypothetical protein
MSIIVHTITTTRRPFPQHFLGGGGGICNTFLLFLFLINDVSGNIFKRNGYLLPVVFFLLLMDARRAAYVPYSANGVRIHIIHRKR